jgi:excisionase family DNA binding protein
MRPPYKAQEAAALLSIGRAWLCARAAEGEIPGAFRTRGNAGHWRFDADKFDQYLHDLREGRTAALRAVLDRKERARKSRQQSMESG